MDGVWPVEQVQDAERRVMAGLPAGALMARAARAIAVQACGLLGFTYGARVMLLVGAGNNGADALYAGAELARRGVRVLAVSADPDRVDAPALAAFRGAGGRLVGPAELSPSAQLDLIIDGLVGIGARGPLRANLLPLIEFAGSSAAPVLAVDLPSGVDPDTGAVSGPAITAAVTVCMGALKPGLLAGEGRQRSGRVRVVELGLAAELPPARIWRLTEQDVGRLLQRPGPQDDKYTRGVVGVCAGSADYPGAALLCVGSARLGGVGAVRYAGHAAAEVVRRHPEVLVTDTVAGAGRVQAWAVGPGLGSAAQAEQSLRAVLAAEVPVVIDADGLNLIAAEPALGGLLRARAERGPAPASVLTPHDREFERLFGEVGPDRIGAARRAAEQSGATVLLKGYVSVIATPDGDCYLNPTGEPALATAGSGDVLAGLIGSLLATGIPAGLAAAAGSYLHGAAAARAAATGPMVAGELISGLRAQIGAVSR